MWKGRCSKDGHRPPIESWRCWSHPTPSLPIDTFISKLKKSHTKGGFKSSLRERTALQSDWRGPFCPYYEIRNTIVSAVSFAEKEWVVVQKGLKTEKPILQQLSADASAIADRIDHFAKRWYSNDLNAAAIFNPRHKLHFFLNDQFELLQEADNLRLTFRSIELAAKKEQSIVAPGGSPVGKWYQEFVLRMGLFFRFLTGDDPTNTIPFREFIAASFETLTGDRKIPESSLRTVFSIAARQDGWNWLAWVSPNHRFDLPVPSFTYIDLLKEMREFVPDVLQDERHLDSFCDFLVMGGRRLENDLRESISKLKMLPGWRKAFNAARTRARESR